MQVILFAGMLVFAAFLSAEEHVATSRDISQTIQNLDSEDFDLRGSAFGLLLKRGESIVPLLQAELKSNNALSAEQRHQILKIIDLHTGGNVENGVRIELKCDKQTASPGDDIVLTVRIKNTCDKPFYVQIGWDDIGNYISAGNFLWMGSTLETLQSPSGILKDRRARLFSPLFEKIAGSSVLEYSIRGSVSKEIVNGKEQGCFKIKSTDYTFELQKDGTYQIQFSYSDEFQSTDGGIGAAPKRLLEKDITIWKGNVKSNVLELKISGIDDR